MLWLKAFHIIAMVCWFAALFYLPRLFVYHAMSDDRISLERFKVMERKLSRGIANPSAVATVILGSWMFALNPQYYLASGWFHAKMTLVALLLAYHIVCLRIVRQFANDTNHRNHVFYRWFNEAPVLVLVGAVILAVVKPF